MQTKTKRLVEYSEGFSQNFVSWIGLFVFM